VLHAKREGFKTVPVDFKRRNFMHLIYLLKRFIEKEHIDIVNTHSSKDSWLVLPAARLAKNKPLTIRTRHLSTPIGKNLMSTFLYNALPHFIITTGEAIRKQMITVNHFNPDKIISIPTGVDTDIFKPEKMYDDVRKELNLEGSTPLVGAVSVIRSWKGLDYLVKAVPFVLKEVPEVRFIIAGEGIHRKTLEKTLEKTGINGKVYLLGYRENIASILNSIDIFVHPSYANEGVSQSILQAMAMEKPVIASNLAPLKEVVIENETGILVPKKEPEGIARAVIRLLRDKKLSKQLGENGRRLAMKSYSFDGMLDKLETLYKENRTSIKNEYLAQRNA
jgi:glycosyltransferase involved in cell wall biosynthesis